jgi:hypothetical protein
LAVLHRTFQTGALKEPDFERGVKQEMQNAKTGQGNSLRTVARQIAYRFSVALLIAVYLVAGLTAQAQVSCLGICEQNLEACTRNNDVLSLAPTCIEIWEACVAACVGATPLFG